MADISVLEQDAISFAQRAVKCDQSGLADTAAFYYTEAAQALVTAAMAGSQMPGILDKVSEYQSRAQLLKHSYGATSSFITQAKSPQQLQLERARFLVEQAFDEDESGNQSDALELYTQAAELCVTLRNQNLDRETYHKVTKLAQQALDRAEQLKPPDPLANAPSPPSSPSAARREVSNKTVMPGPLGFSLREDQIGQNTAAQPARRGVGASYGGGVHAGVGGASSSAGGAGEYTKEEIHVLRTTSCINGRNFVPFMAADLKERFGYPVPFGDRDGKLALSPKQRSRLEGWRRPEDIMSNPQMIYAVSSFSIKQTIVSDCSFVASLAISAQYERRFNTKLITSIIYPQNRKGEPQYNPCGKYMVKLNINGVPRKVIIDDYLPAGRGSDLLCSYSNNRNELWVSLLEKAYMKVMGGYDFPGSNSNIDLNALTGWIPERVAIRPGSSEFDPDKEFKKIKDRFHRGDCLVTVATGELSQDEADRAGLVSTHAYAMLDIIEIKGFKLFQLKNPWSHMRWRGNFSELDKKHWTPDLQKALNFNPDTAASVDNGVFWIDYESMMKFFDVIYINWRPSIFDHTTCMHYTWTAKEGPKKDLYNIGDNPQYRLEVKANEGAVVWILLTRHITDKDDFANNREFITLVVYKTDGRRIFYPSDPPPHKDGVRINSPHYLCKMVQEKGTGVYTLVVSQYEKNNTIHYTLRVYCTCDFKLSHIKEPYNPKYEKQVTGEWKGRTAGGCPNYPDTFPNNPIYQLRVDKPGCHVLVELRGPKNCSVGFTIVAVDVPGCPDNLKRQSSGAYRPGFCVLEVDNLPRGVYNIQPCTFLPNQELPFFLNISSSTPISLTHMQ